MNRKGQHFPRDNKWAVRKSGSDRVTRKFDTQREAIEVAREFARNRTEVYIHGRDGRIDSYGKSTNRMTEIWFDFNHNVFVNCPFDPDYAPIMQAVLFCLVRFGFNPRIATEQSNAAEPRIDKICELIRASKYSIHDLSRCQARQAEEL